MNRLRRFLAMIIALSTLCLACGPALVQQRQLNNLGSSAVSSCRAQKRPAACKASPTSAACAAATKICQAALLCVKAVAQSNADTQAAQVARAGVGADAEQEALASASYAAAVAACAAGGWR
jgi:hypothetical protein